MWAEDIKTFSRLGKALLPDPDESSHSAVETLSAVALLQLTPERTLEKASRALLERARGTKFRNLQHRFFRLSAEARLILTGLHLGRWSYGRIARILGVPADTVEKIAWAARLELSIGSHEYPSGPSHLGPKCPEYKSETPWTQRFLDEETAKASDRVFLQNHLLSCKSCAEALTRCRKLYFYVDRELNTLMDSLDDEEEEVLIALENSLRSSPTRQYHSQRSFLQSLVLFFRRRDIFWISMVTVVLLIFLMAVRSR